MSLLILSEETDQTINKIIDYLFYLGKDDFERLNTEDSIKNISVLIDNSSMCNSLENLLKPHQHFSLHLI